MDTVRPKSALTSKSKLARTFQKVINLRTATRISSNNGICLLTPQGCRVKEHEDDDVFDKSKHFDKVSEDVRARNRAVMEALVAKLFAGITSIKAAYAELQMAQNPYNGEAIQGADLAVVHELKAISELKRSFLKKELDLSPQVTIMLAEIQEQQGLMKTYEITIKKLEAEVDRKDSDISELRKKLEESVSMNKSMEKKLNSSGSLSVFDNLRGSGLNPTHFTEFLNHVTLRSVRNFVKVLVREMESANWDLDAAVRVIEPEAVFSKQSHRCFAFESFVCKTMLEGFNHPGFSIPGGESPPPTGAGEGFFDQFKKLKSVSPKHLFTQNPNSSFGKFLRTKYLQLVHAKMECSFFGNLNQRKMVTSCGYPETPFFAAFAEMAKRVWLLHSLAFSFGEDDVTVFQVRKDSRFSEVYMECVTQEVLFSSGEIDPNPDWELRVNFTVVPGFKIGKTVFQSQVYLSPVASPASRR
ncbi:hypothetical protein PanWU01x14_001960 [Parasponia andersonii]|uniref:Uncharacterized protein n=1 Tax=Parasponia andersonii TaxID=3476 RepID=A0A2P5E570_PARAD|nr:hypothetical protein PanWU01x14_001960 [Parasponia andersonii]